MVFSKANKWILLFVLLCSWSDYVYSQQHLKTSLYMFTLSAFNPGSSGTRSSPTFSATSRNQWWGLTGSPTFTRVSGTTPLNGNQGAGANITLK